MNKSEKQPELPTFLLDRNIAGISLRRCFTQGQWPKKTQGELGFPKEAPDAQLIRAAGEQKMVFLTADWNIQRQPENVKAAIEAKAQIVFVPHHAPKDLFCLLWLAKAQLCDMLERAEGAVFINIANEIKGIAAYAAIQPGDERAGVVRSKFGHREAKAIHKKTSLRRRPTRSHDTQLGLELRDSP